LDTGSIFDTENCRKFDYFQQVAALVAIFIP